MVSPTFEEKSVFDALKLLLSRYAASLSVVVDDADNYWLDTLHIMNNGKPLFFGAVQVRKKYVSFHLMPIYVNPSLLESMSDGLERRMHGKSCFNFTTVEPELMDELAVLTASGYDYYVDEAYILAEPENE